MLTYECTYVTVCVKTSIYTLIYLREVHVFFNLFLPGGDWCRGAALGAGDAPMNEGRGRGYGQSLPQSDLKG